MHEGLKPFLCEVCSYKTSQKQSLKKHIDVIHRGLKPFKCPSCSYTAGQKGHLKKHLLTAHKYNNTDSNLPVNLTNKY